MISTVISDRNWVTNSYIHQRLLSTCSVPGTMPDTKDATGKSLSMQVVTIRGRKESDAGQVPRELQGKGDHVHGRRHHSWSTL